MDKREVLKFCVENGFYLDRGMLDFFVGLKEGEFRDAVLKLKGFGLEEKILTRAVFERYKGRLGFSGVSRKSGLKVLNEVLEGEGVLVGDFVSYFRSRFEVLRDVLIKRGLENISSIRRIGQDNGVFCVIGMVYDKRVTKNKNLLIEIEDLTGRCVVLVNRDNKQLFKQASELFLDDVVGFRVSGSSKMLFASEFVYPDACLDSEVFGVEDSYVVFVSDLHVGSRQFLDENLGRFVDWLNGDVGDLRQKGIALKVKYLVLVGDNIEGVGVYPGQERFLRIKSIRGQYEKLAEILGRVRKDVEIIVCPGSHDASWVGVPQMAISDKWASSLSSLENLRLVSNPCFFEVGGLKVLAYYGASLNQIRGLGVLEGKGVLDLVNGLLKRRHLAPVYGLNDIVPNKERDDLVLGDEVLPDVFVVGGQHRARVGSYNNIVTISTSCFQGITDFEVKVGNSPEPCRVPILNLKSKEVKILDFSGVSCSEVVWESGDDLVCELDGEVKKL